MTSDSVKLPPEARQRVEAYLDAIERVLVGAGMARGERRGITDEVETQIGEMLAARAGAEPTAADVEAVLASLDPPEAYAPDAGAAAGAGGVPPAGAGQAGAAAPGAMLAAARRPHFSRAAIAGACCAALTCVILVPLVAVVVPVLAYRLAFAEAPVLQTERPAGGLPGAPVSPGEESAAPASPGEESVAPGKESVSPGDAPVAPSPRGRGGAAVSWAVAAAYVRAAGASRAAIIMAIPLGLLLLAGPAATTILGVVAIGHIRRSAGMIYGMGLAMFDALVFPLLALDLALIAGACLAASGLGVKVVIGLALGLALAAAADAGLVRLSWRRWGGAAALAR